MTIKNEVQGVVQALFGAFAGGYLPELTDEATNNGTSAMTARLVDVQGIILGKDMTSNQVFVDTILANMGVPSTNAAYAAASGWAMNELTNGGTRADVVSAAVAFLTGIAAGTIVDSNYTAIATAFTDKVAEGIEASEGDMAEEFSFVSLQTAASSLNLTAALVTLTAAVEAQAAFLKEEDMTEAQIAATIDPSNVGGAVTVFNANTYANNPLAAASTASQQAAAFASARANADSAIAAQEVVVATAQAAVTALDKADEVAAYTAALAADTAAGEALSAAQTTEAGASAEYDFINTPIALTDITINTTTGDVAVAGTGVNFVVADNTGDVGVVEAAANVTETTNPGITALINALNARMAAEFADAAAGAEVTATAAAVGTADVGKVTTLVTEQATLETLETADATLEEVIADVQVAYALNAQLNALNESIDDAVSAINVGGFNAVSLDGGVASATDTAGPAGADLENDVFLFTGAAATPISITGFNADGADIIKFDAGTYTLVEVDEADFMGGTNEMAAGSATVLEIFVVDTGAHTILYVEENAFDGSTVAAQDNAVVITLTGVTGEEFVLANNGYLTIA